MLDTIDIWTAVYVYLRTDRALYETQEVEHAQERTPTLNESTTNELWLPGRTGRLVTQSLTL